ncbi:MAG: hypothetical protein ACHQUC_04885, partial [Chlamydiales bacterium]
NRMNNNTINTNVQFTSYSNGTGQYDFSISGKDYTVYQDKVGQLSVNPNLKGAALEDAKLALEIVKQVKQALEQTAKENQTTGQQTHQPLEEKKIHPFSQGFLRIIKAKVLENDPLSALEKTIDSYIGAIHNYSELPSSGLTTLTMLKGKLKTLSDERKQKIESKFSWIREFFHKVAQYFRGGGYQTLATRADALSSKIEGLIPAVEQRSVQLELDLLKWGLEEIASNPKLPRDDKQKTFNQINQLKKDEFEEILSIYFNPKKFISCNELYQNLSPEKRQMFDNLILARADWYTFVNNNFYQQQINGPEAKNILELPGVDKERYFNQFMQNFQQISQKEKENLASSGAMRSRLVETLFAGDEELPPNLALPSHISNNFLKQMFREAVEKYTQGENIGTVLELLDALNLESGTYWKDRVFYVIKPKMAEKISIKTINEILNRETLSEAVIAILQANVKCEKYHLFPETTATTTKS